MVIWIYKLKKIMCRTEVSDQFRKIIICHKRIGYDLNVIRRSACLAVNPIDKQKTKICKHLKMINPIFSIC